MYRGHRERRYRRDTETTMTNPTSSTQATETTIRCRAFTGEPVREHRVSVAVDGTVRVYDSVAGHYTLCHALSPRAVARIRSAVAS
jgi:hypothetical protein